jgi:hypothetical protein
MYIFFKFLIIFLYLELGILLFSFAIELYRIIAYNYAIHNNSSNMFKRRVLKEITSISKNNTNEFFDFNFFLIFLFFFFKCI